MNDLTDIHCHILPATDDGAKTISDALDILENAASAGYANLILTPHFITDTPYAFDNASKKKLLKVLKKGLKLRGLKLKLYLGNESYLTPYLNELVAGNYISTLAGSRYLLVELPLTTEDQTATNTFFRLLSDGYVPVIAHPERYHYFQENLSKIQPYLDQGCLLQGDYQSLFGKYGHKSKKTLIRLLRQNKIHFLASDTHKPTDDYNLQKAIKKVSRLTSPETATKLFSSNPAKILTNQSL